MCQLYLNQVCNLVHCKMCYLNKLIKSVKEAHIANHYMHLTETCAVKLLQIGVSYASAKKVIARILLIELTKITSFSRFNVTKNANWWCHKSTGVVLSIKSRCEMQCSLKPYIVCQGFYYLFFFHTSDNLPL